MIEVPRCSGDGVYVETLMGGYRGLWARAGAQLPRELNVAVGLNLKLGLWPSPSIGDSL